MHTNGCSRATMSGIVWRHGKERVGGMADDTNSSEPEYIDEATGKPIIYADNVPEILRGLTVENCGFAMNDSHFEYLDKMGHIERAALGMNEWNRWVQWAQLKNARWLERREQQNEVHVSAKERGDKGYNSLVINMDVGLKRDSNFHYDIAVFDFRGFIFPARVSFEGARFPQAVDFSHAEFLGYAKFVRSEFRGDARFTSVKFYGAARFERSHFNGGAFFVDALLHRGGRFIGSKFDGDANFSGVWFAKSAWFSEVVVGGSANFQEAQFINEARFIEANFKGAVKLTNSTFRNNVSFIRSKFSGYFEASSTVFLNDTNFKRAQFGRGCVCQATKFVGNVSWKNAEFRAGGDFHACRFAGEVDFTSVLFTGHINFDHATFGVKKVDMLDDDVSDSATQKNNGLAPFQTNCSNGSVPDFKGAQFGVPPNLGYTEIIIPTASFPSAWFIGKKFKFLFSNKSFAEDADAASKLRRLQELAAAGHHHLAEKRFFRAELLCRRGHEATSWPEITMINLFELFSGCGLSFRKPVLWLLGLIVACGVVYFSQIDWTFAEMNSDGESWFDLVSYSVLNSLPLIGYASDTYGVAVDVLFGGIDKVPWFVKLTAFFQNIASAILLFFALLAIRNYFKLG